MLSLYIMVINKIEKAYLAGLFDGEGSISIVHQRSPRKDNPEHRIHRLVVMIGMTDKPPIQKLYDAFKFGCFDEKPIKSPNHKTIYRVTMCGKQGLKFLETLYPFLIVKKERAEIGMEFQKRLTKIGHNGFADRTWENSFCDRIRVLNRRCGNAKKLIPCWFAKNRGQTWNKGLKSALDRERNESGQFI